MAFEGLRRAQEGEFFPQNYMGTLQSLLHFSDELRKFMQIQNIY